MTEISFYITEDDRFFGFEAEGHAGYAKFGKDIVCAAISALTATFINSVDELTESKISVEADEKTGYMDVRVEDYDKDDVQLLFKSLELGLKEIEKQYKRNVKLTNRRCKP